MAKGKEAIVLKEVAYILPLYIYRLSLVFTKTQKQSNVFISNPRLVQLSVEERGVNNNSSQFGVITHVTGTTLQFTHIASFILLTAL